MIQSCVVHLVFLTLTLTLTLTLFITAASLVFFHSSSFLFFCLSSSIVKPVVVVVVPTRATILPNPPSNPSRKSPQSRRHTPFLPSISRAERVGSRPVWRTTRKSRKSERVSLFYTASRAKSHFVLLAAPHYCLALFDAE